MTAKMTVFKVMLMIHDTVKQDISPEKVQNIGYTNAIQIIRKMRTENIEFSVLINGYPNAWIVLLKTPLTEAMQ